MEQQIKKVVTHEIHTSIVPWLTVSNAEKALTFYKSAFGAIEVYKFETPDGVVARLSVDGAEYWLSGGSGSQELVLSEPSKQTAIRMILTVQNPEEVFDLALKEGATLVYPISEGHGWKIGRLIDPFGHHWEIGHPVE